MASKGAFLGVLSVTSPAGPAAQPRLMSKCRVTQNVICRPCHTSLIFTSASANLWTLIWATNKQTLMLKSLPGLLDGSKAKHLLNMPNL